MNSNINNSSSKPIKKMVLWSRPTNCKSTSPHVKENIDIQNKKNVKSSKSGKKENVNSNNNDSTIKTKDMTNVSINRNNLNYSRITSNKLEKSQGGSFQSNSNDEDKNNSRNKDISDSSNKKNEKNSTFINNIKFKKKINLNYSPNAINTNNINSSEFHTNNAYKYFHSTNEMNIKKKENKPNCITDNNIIKGQNKKSISKKKISLDKEKKLLSNSKKKISPTHNHQITPLTNNNLSNSINVYNNSNNNIYHLNNNINSLNSNGNINYTIFNQCKRNMNSIPSSQKMKKNTYNEQQNDNELNNNKNENSSINKVTKENNKNNSKSKNKNFNVSEKIKYLEEENKKLKMENNNLLKKNKELKILVSKLENEIIEVKSVIKDNLNQFIQPQNDLINKTYKQLMEQIEKQKEILTKTLNNQKASISVEERASKAKEEGNNQKTPIKDVRNNYRMFKKNFFEFFNHVNTSNTSINGYPAGSDPLKNTLNSFCCFMDNIINKLEEKFINMDKKENKNKDNNIESIDNNINNYRNNFAEVCLINLYYEYVIMQLFIVSFFERQHCYYCYSILDYILISPFMIIKNNNYIKDFTKRINKIIEVYKKINEEYINRFTDQNIFYLKNYIKLFNLIINNKISFGSNIKIDNEIFEKNTNILFNNKQTQNVYLNMINKLLEKIQNNQVNQSNEKIFDQNKNKGKNKINTIKLTGENLERISNSSNCSSRIIDNYSEKPSFYGFLRSDDMPPDMSLGDDDI